MTDQCLRNNSVPKACNSIARYFISLMGTTVSLISSPEPNDTSLVEKVRETLSQYPMRAASMVQIGRMISEADDEEKMELLNSGVVGCIVKQISNYHVGWKANKENALINTDTGVKNSNMVKLNGSKGKRRNNGFVTQITIGRRQVNAELLSRGIGYSRGTTRCQWDIERYIEETIVREEQLTWLMKLLTAYMYSFSPDFSDPETVFDNINKEAAFKSTGTQIANLLNGTTVVPMIRYHLKNESIFDISERLDFYIALLDMLCALVIHPPLTNEILQPERANDESLLRHLLPHFRSLIVSYLAFTRLKLRTPDLRLTEFLEKVDTCQRLLVACNKRRFDKQCEQTKVFEQNPALPTTIANETTIARPVVRTLSTYAKTMKTLQIRSWRFIDEAGKWKVPYVYHKEAKSLNPLSPSLKDRGKRIAREIASFENNLPLSESNSIFICVEESRCDVMKVLITGPDQTPYQNGCFEFDIFFPVSYPFSPPKMTFLTTNGGDVRFNPNLYQDGKVCLSILNTWEGRPEEKWNPCCSLLQLLVSIQALIFVKEPYFNEPGFEKYMLSERGQSLSRAYNRQLKAATLQVAILEQLRHGSDYFQEVVDRHVWIKREGILQQARQCVEEAMTTGRAESIKNECRKSLYTSENDSMSFKSVGETTEAIYKELRRLEERFSDRKNPVTNKTS